MKTVYVVWKMNDGGLKSDTLYIGGKLNNLSVQRAVRDHLSYYDRFDFDRIISWQVEEEFTDEEYVEFFKKGDYLSQS